MFSISSKLKIYFIIGLGAFALDFTVFNLSFYYFNLEILYSNFYGYLSGLFFSFLLNRNFNFKKKDKIFVRFIIFWMVSFLGLIIGTLLIYLFTVLFYTWLSKILSAFIVFILQFTLNKKITFK